MTYVWYRTQQWKKMSPMQVRINEVMKLKLLSPNFRNNLLTYQALAEWVIIIFTDSVRPDRKNTIYIWTGGSHNSQDLFVAN